MLSQKTMKQSTKLSNYCVQSVNKLKFLNFDIEIKVHIQGVGDLIDNDKYRYLKSRRDIENTSWDVVSSVIETSNCSLKTVIVNKSKFNVLKIFFHSCESYRNSLLCDDTFFNCCTHRLLQIGNHQIFIPPELEMVKLGW